ncbi:MAG: glycosyltransferase [Candidatus Omnitrophica bacterium]|nr:glycosyltransferase [Candidatus Omnitrophota bacterium]
MKYSIVIISKDRRDLLLKCLHKLVAIKDHPEIIVVEAADSLPPITLQGVTYIQIPAAQSGYAYQRNLAIQHARGEYIVFADDDIDITPEWYGRLTAPVDEDPKIAGVMGGVFPDQPTIIGFCEGVLGHPGGGFRMHHQAKGRLYPLDQVATCNTIIKKSVIEAVGGFDLRNHHGSEDSDLCIRVTKQYGLRQFRYVPDALVYHKPRNAFKKIIPWYIRRGKADMELFLKHSTHLKYVLQTSILMKVLILLAFAWIFKSAWILPAGLALWYGMQLFRSVFMFNYFSYYHFSSIQRILIFFIFPAIKLVADFMFDLGRLQRILSSR